MKTQILVFILFFLLVFTVLGIAIYVYLRQEQEKATKPKDKYDEAWSKVDRKKPIWNIRLTYLDRAGGAEISMGLGVLSNIALLFLTTSSFSIFSGLISCIGSFAAIAGFFIGVFGALQTKTESSLLVRYGGVFFSAIGISNICFVLEYLIPIVILAAWISS